MHSGSSFLQRLRNYIAYVRRTGNYPFHLYHLWKKITGRNTEASLTASFLPLDYAHTSRVRWPGGHPTLRARMERETNAYREALQLLETFAPSLRALRKQQHQLDPDPDYGIFSGLDLVMEYAMLLRFRPLRFVEIGSGNSTLVANRVRRDHQLNFEHTIIDPYAGPLAKRAADRVILHKLEDLGPAQFPDLSPGDFLFLDGSHRVLQNSDVTVFFLEILPNLPQGVIVHIHDIYLPFDYPAGLMDQFYSEQYLLATWLLANPDSTRILFPAWYAQTCMAEDVRRSMRSIGWEAEKGTCFGLWFETQRTVVGA